jgi:SAM-dependent methyltransferase
MKIFQQFNVPTNQNLLHKTKSDAKNASAGDLDIRCDDNGFIFNAAFDINKVNYGDEYDNNQNYSPYFESYIDTQIEWLSKNYIPVNATVVEVGCGKGYYVEKIAKMRKDCKIYGFDTSYKENDKNHYPNLKIYKKYYDKECKYLYPDVIICRHVIEHISCPEEFLCEIRASMPENAILFLETPDVEWILENNVIFDFFYEHCSYWTRSSLENVLHTSGFEQLESTIEFNGQYLWNVSKASHKTEMVQVNNNDHIKNLCLDFSDKREQEINTVIQKLNILAKESIPLYIWGAGAKGVSFVNLFDPKRKLISFIIDINTNKQNKYIAKTAHKVVAPETITTVSSGKGIIIVLNSNYKTEIERKISDLGLNYVIYTYEELKKIKVTIE